MGFFNKQTPVKRVQEQTQSQCVALVCVLTEDNEKELWAHLQNQNIGCASKIKTFLLVIFRCDNGIVVLFL